MTRNKISRILILLVLSTLASTQDLVGTSSSDNLPHGAINCNGKSAVCVGPLMYQDCVSDANGLMYGTGKAKACPDNSRCVNDGVDICKPLKISTDSPVTNATVSTSNAPAVSEPSTEGLITEGIYSSLSEGFTTTNVPVEASAAPLETTYETLTDAADTTLSPTEITNILEETSTVPQDSIQSPAVTTIIIETLQDEATLTPSLDSDTTIPIEAIDYPLPDPSSPIETSTSHDGTENPENLDVTTEAILENVEVATTTTTTSFDESAAVDTAVSYSGIDETFIPNDPNVGPVNPTSSIEPNETDIPNTAVASDAPDSITTDPVDTAAIFDDLSTVPNDSDVADVGSANTEQTSALEPTAVEIGTAGEPTSIPDLHNNENNSTAATPSTETDTSGNITTSSIDSPSVPIEDTASNNSNALDVDPTTVYPDALADQNASIDQNGAASPSNAIAEASASSAADSTLQNNQNGASDPNVIVSSSEPTQSNTVSGSNITVSQPSSDHSSPGEGGLSPNIPANTTAVGIPDSPVISNVADGSSSANAATGSADSAASEDTNVESNATTGNLDDPNNTIIPDTSLPTGTSTDAIAAVSPSASIDQNAATNEDVATLSAASESSIASTDAIAAEAISNTSTSVSTSGDDITLVSPNVAVDENAPTQPDIDIASSASGSSIGSSDAIGAVDQNVEAHPNTSTSVSCCGDASTSVGQNVSLDQNASTQPDIAVASAASEISSGSPDAIVTSTSAGATGDASIDPILSYDQNVAGHPDITNVSDTASEGSSVTSTSVNQSGDANASVDTNASIDPNSPAHSIGSTVNGTPGGSSGSSDIDNSEANGNTSASSSAVAADIADAPAHPNVSDGPVISEGAIGSTNAAASNDESTPQGTIEQNVPLHPDNASITGSSITPTDAIVSINTNAVSSPNSASISHDHSAPGDKNIAVDSSNSDESTGSADVSVESHKPVDLNTSTDSKLPSKPILQENNAGANDAAHTSGGGSNTQENPENLNIGLNLTPAEEKPLSKEDASIEDNSNENNESKKNSEKDDEKKRKKEEKEEEKRKKEEEKKKKKEEKEVEKQKKEEEKREKEEQKKKRKDDEEKRKKDKKKESKNNNDSEERNDDTEERKQKDNKLIKKIVKIIKDEDCDEDDIYPDVEDCKKYYRCIEKSGKTKFEHLHCSNHQRFDFEDKKCVEEGEAKCLLKQE